MTMSDRIAVMNKGKYEQLGEPEALYERTEDEVRRGLPGRQQPVARWTPTERPDGLRGVQARRRPACRVPSALGRRAGGTVALGVRPEIRITETCKEVPQASTGSPGRSRMPRISA